MEDSTYSRIYQTAILSEVRRRLFEESFARIRRCLDMLSEKQIWYRPNSVSNSVGNLVLHICGNATQWIVSGLGGKADERNRQAEFEEQGPIPASRLLDKLDETEATVEAVLDDLKPEHLLQTFHVQAFRETGVSMLFHVVEHASYHVGQITYLTKWIKEEQTNYYGDIDLEETNKGSV